jgi:hypothetical protein
MPGRSGRAQPAAIPPGAPPTDWRPRATRAPRQHHPVRRSGESVRQIDREQHRRRGGRRASGWDPPARSPTVEGGSACSVATGGVKCSVAAGAGEDPPDRSPTAGQIRLIGRRRRVGSACSAAGGRSAPLSAVTDVRSWPPRHSP